MMMKEMVLMLISSTFHFTNYSTCEICSKSLDVIFFLVHLVRYDRNQQSLASLPKIPQIPLSFIKTNYTNVILLTLSILNASFWRKKKWTLFLYKYIKLETSYFYNNFNKKMLLKFLLIVTQKLICQNWCIFKKK